MRNVESSCLTVLLEETMRRFILILALMATLTVSGCAAMTTPNPPAISDISDSMVKVRNTRETIFREWASPNQILNEAQRGCARYGKNAQFVSSWCVGNKRICQANSSGWVYCYGGECEVMEHLFTCN